MVVNLLTARLIHVVCLCLGLTTVPGLSSPPIPCHLSESYRTTTAPVAVCSMSSVSIWDTIVVCPMSPVTLNLRYCPCPSHVICNALSLGHCHCVSPVVCLSLRPRLPLSLSVPSLSQSGTTNAPVVCLVLSVTPTVPSSPAPRPVWE